MTVNELKAKVEDAIARGYGDHEIVINYGGSVWEEEGSLIGFCRDEDCGTNEIEILYGDPNRHRWQKCIDEDDG